MYLHMSLLSILLSSLYLVVQIKYFQLHVSFTGSLFHLLQAWVLLNADVLANNSATVFLPSQTFMIYHGFASIRQSITSAYYNCLSRGQFHKLLEITWVSVYIKSKVDL